MIRKTLTILAAAMLLPSLLVAQGDRERPERPEGSERGDRPERGGSPEGRMTPPAFEDLDANGDGKVTQKEFTAHMVKQARERAGGIFARMDQNNDGELSEREMPQRRGPGGDRQGPPREGARDGDRPRTGSGDGDRSRTGPGDGDRPRTGPRDGDKPKRGSGDGDKPKRPDVED